MEPIDLWALVIIYLVTRLARPILFFIIHLVMPIEKLKEFREFYSVLKKRK